MLLVTTEVAPDVDVHVRVIGAVANSTIRIYGGTPGGQTCASPPGVCVEMTSPRILGLGRSNADGEITLRFHVPASAAVGTPLVLQAVAQAPNAAWYTSDPFDTVVHAAATAPPAGGNVLVVLLDDIGVDAVSTYGASTGAATPTIDGLAAEGMRFDNAWAMPICAPTRAALQTGRFPRRTGYGSNVIPPTGLNELGPEQITLAEMVEASPWYEYSTALLGKWHLSTNQSPSGRIGPKVQGYDVFFGTSGNIDRTFWIPGSEAPTDAGYFHWQRTIDDGRLSEETTYSSTKIVDDALMVIGQLQEPWLVVVSFHGAHSPWEPPPPELHTRGALTDRSPIPDLHRAMTEAVDTELGRLLANVAPGLLDRTTLFVLGDNGTKQEAVMPPYNPWRSKREVYDGGVRVPFVVKGPGVPAGTVSASLVNVVDLFPTIAEIAGVDVAQLPDPLDRTAPLPLDGMSLVPVLADPTAPAHDLLYAERFAPGGQGPFEYDRRSVRNERYKLVYDAIDDREQFFQYLPGALDEGPDLLACGLMTPELEVERAALRARLDELMASMPYDAQPMVEDHDGWQIGVRNYDTSCPAQ